MDKISDLKKIVINTLDLNKAQDIITIDLKDYVISEGWDIRKVQFIPNFVSENKNGKINLKNSYNDTIICMGRFHENKAIDIMIKSMSFLPGFNLLIIGEGKLKETYNLLINKYHLGERVEIIGWRKYKLERHKKTS